MRQKIASKQQIVQLTKQLTNVAGCLWVKSLMNARAERNEMLLMHMFWRRGYVLPDKMDKFSKGEEFLGHQENKGNNKKNNRNKYQGGMVFEPISGLYDDIILLLDYNSLYPSIIREYKICFTTVERPYMDKEEQEKKPEENDDTLPSYFNHDPNLIKESKKVCILPDVIKSLLDRRKQVKQAIKGEKNPEKLEQLDIRQKSFKLIANSIYGCLGFSFSRFYAKPIAALVTYFGRNILKGSFEKVKSLGYEVIYGDTDSLMINSRQKDTIKALQVGTEIKREINLQFKSKILEIEIDGLFKVLLQLKKKKYAALKVDNYNDILNNPDPKVTIQEELGKEIKGQDVVRRDWCVLSKEVGYKLLDLILSQRLREDIISDIYHYMEDLGLKIKQNKIDTEKFVIYKQLNKLPHEYPPNTQPHVNVAKRLKEQKKIPDDQLLHHFIAYIICKGNQASYCERAYSVEEVKLSQKSNETLEPVIQLINSIA